MLFWTFGTCLAAWIPTSMAANSLQFEVQPSKRTVVGNQTNASLMEKLSLTNISHFKTHKAPKGTKVSLSIVDHNS